MHVSIWQQFSSNHSATFTVIGEFKTADLAQSATEACLAIFTTIEQWREVPENAALLEHQRYYSDPKYVIDPPPTPPEIAISQQYGVEWGGSSIDWIGPVDLIHERIRRVDSRVFISVDFETWNHPVPVVNLIEKMGGSALVEYVDGVPQRTIHLTCTAPDKNTAQTLYQMMDAYFRRTWRGMPVLWQPEHTNESIASFVGDGTIQVEGLRVTVDIEFWKLGVGFPALIDYLRDQGCTAIEFAIMEPGTQ